MAFVNIKSAGQRIARRFSVNEANLNAEGKTSFDELAEGVTLRSRGNIKTLVVGVICPTY